MNTLVIISIAIISFGIGWVIGFLNGAFGDGPNEPWT